MKSVRRALILASGERYVALIGNFVTLAIASRLLTPAELGVHVVGMTVAGLMMTVREFAGTPFVIQHIDITIRQIRSAFTLAFLITAAASAGIVTFAPLVANIFDDMRLVSYFYVVSAALVVETFGYFICMLLRREMKFQKFALVNLAGTISLNSATILLILLGFSYMSFAWAWLATAVVVSGTGRGDLA